MPGVKRKFIGKIGEIRGKNPAFTQIAELQRQELTKDE